MKLVGYFLDEVGLLVFLHLFPSVYDEFHTAYPALSAAFSARANRPII
jgi:hypothetical protein